jgi:hypothetical protein
MPGGDVAVILSFVPAVRFYMLVRPGTYAFQGRDAGPFRQGNPDGPSR